MIAMAVFVMRNTFKQCLRSQRGCFYPELRPESFSFPVRTMTGNTARAVHTHMKVHVAITTAGADRAARDAATGEIDTFAIGDICQGSCAASRGAMVKPAIAGSEKQECHQNKSFLCQGSLRSSDSTIRCILH